MAEIKQYIQDNDLGEDEPAKNPEEADDWGNTMSQWTMEEELYVGHHHQARAGIRGSGLWSMFGLLARVGILVGGFLAVRPLVRKAYLDLAGGGGTGEKKSKSKKFDGETSPNVIVV